MSVTDQFDHTQLTEAQSKQVLQEYDIPIAHGDTVASVKEAHELAEELSYPLFMKLTSREIQHKTDAGVVKKIETKEDIEPAFTAIKERTEELDATFESVLLEESCSGDEFIAGISQDPQFGSVLMFGLGGIYVEVFKDVQFRAVPVQRYDIEQMIDGLMSKPLLEGVRDRPPADMDKLVDTLYRLSELADEEPIDELDINPLFIDGDEIRAADALITLEADTDA